MPSNQPAAPAPKGNRTFFIVLVVVGVGLFGLLVCGGIIAAIVIPAMINSKNLACETQCLANLKSLHTAQTQFSFKHGYFAGSAVQLSRDDALSSPSLAMAFESWRDNGDKQATAANSYTYRMLLGEGANPTSWVSKDKGPDGLHLSSWAATGKPVEPGSTGRFQFFIGEAGLLYKSDSTTAPTFLLDAAPNLTQTTQWHLAK